jgi:alpha-D-ribose 1-methylphosphonate 5-triphosphate diphosphatase
MSRHILSNATLVLPNRTVNGSIVISDGRIEDVQPECNYAEGVDLNGQYLAPGVIDIHTDYLEKEINPRPETNFPVALAFHLMDLRAIGCGVTTVLGAARVSAETEGPLGSWTGNGIQLIEEYARLRHTSLSRHYVHVRWDPCFGSCETSLQQVMAHREVIGNLVFNDSTPGQRQYRNTYAEQVKRWALMKNISVAEAAAWFEERIKKAREVNNRAQVQNALRDSIPVGSHDDTTIEHVEEARHFGATLAEMPVTIEAARKAKEFGMLVCMGAPNYYRGGSHCGNLSCHEALAEDLVDILCSDYHFPSLLGSAVRMMNAGTAPHDALRMMTLNPARHLRKDHELGSLEAGKLADLVVFQDKRDYAYVTQVWVDGQCKFTAAE